MNYAKALNYLLKLLVNAAPLATVIILVIGIGLWLLTKLSKK